MDDMPKKPTILYFIDGPTHKPEDLLEAQAYSIAKVNYENAQLTAVARKDVDGVAGSVIPPCYKGYPKADKVVSDYLSAIENARKKSKDKQAPKPVTTPEEREEFDGEAEEAAPKAKPKAKPKKK